MKKNIYVLAKENWKVVSGVIGAIIVIGGIGANYATVTIQNRHTNEKLDRTNSIATNHIYHLQVDMVDVKDRMARLETDVSYIKDDTNFIKGYILKRTLENEKSF